MGARETERPADRNCFLQGDILEIESRSDVDSSFPKYGVVLNADCDLVNNKIDGVIAFLPVYPFQSYLEKFWIPTFLKAQKETLLRSILQISNLSESDPRDLLSWIQDEDFFSVKEKFLGRVGRARPRRLIEEKFSKLLPCLDAEDSPWKALKDFCQDSDDSVRSAKKILERAKKEMGDGHFFISDLFGVSEIGFVVRMRRIYTLSAKQCHLTYASKAASEEEFEISANRIAKLTDIYRFKLIQLFAHQFSRIGLPDEITALDNLAVDDLANKLARNDS